MMLQNIEDDKKHSMQGAILLCLVNFLGRMSYFVVSVVQEDVHTGSTALALTLGLRVFS